MVKKSVEVKLTKKQFEDWVKNPKTKNKYKWKLTTYGSIRASAPGMVCYCPMEVLNRDLGGKGKTFPTSLGGGESLNGKLDTDVMLAADEWSWQIDDRFDRSAKRLRGLMLRTFGLKEPKEENPNNW